MEAQGSMGDELFHGTPSGTYFADLQYESKADCWDSTLKYQTPESVEQLALIA
jgi:hypothetical protein